MWYRKMTGIVFFLLLAVVPLSVHAQATPEPGYLVQFTPQATPADRQDWMDRHCAEEVSWMPQIYVAEVRFEGQCKASMSISAQDEGLVTSIEQDVVVRGTSTITDPIISDRISGYPWRQIQAVNAWEISRGDGDVVIAIIDSGIDLTHPEFAGRILPGYDFVNSDEDPSDDFGHGTSVSGVAAASADGLGMVGMCPKCKILPIKALNKLNMGTWSTVARSIVYAVDRGVDVINMSLGAQMTTTAIISAVEYARMHDVVVVAAVGNEESDKPFFPAALPGVIGVSGTNDKDGSWVFNNHGYYVDVAAPASGIVSTKNGGGYKAESGTSLATPFVSGVAALIRSHRPDLTAKEVEDILESTATDLGDPGWDPYFGFGRLDAYQALIKANYGFDAPTFLYLPNVIRGE